MNNNLILNQKVEEEAIKIFNKFLEYVKNQNNMIKFINYINTILPNRNKYIEIERRQIIESVLLKIFVAYSSTINQ